jgi:hypothetical protein
MDNNFHSDPIARERVIAGYLAGTLPRAASEEFENHYLGCDDCYEEIRGAELLISVIRRPSVESVETDGITVIRFTGSAQLTVMSSELRELVRLIGERSDTKVLIDLQKVSRIDSTGLGMLMHQARLVAHENRRRRPDFRGRSRGAQQLRLNRRRFGRLFL